MAAARSHEGIRRAGLPDALPLGDVADRGRRAVPDGDAHRLASCGQAPRRRRREGRRRIRQADPGREGRDHPRPRTPVGKERSDGLHPGPAGRPVRLLDDRQPGDARPRHIGRGLDRPAQPASGDRPA